MTALGGVAPLGIVLQTEMSPVRFLVGAHAWLQTLWSAPIGVMAEGRRQQHLCFLSLSFSLPPPLSKIIFF